MTTSTLAGMQAASAHDNDPEAVRLLPQRQCDGRLRKLQDACELLADGFDGLDGFVGEYVAATPTRGRTSTHADVAGFLRWLEQRLDLDDEQRDFIAAVQGRQVVEFVAVKQRLAHARFQHLLTLGNVEADGPRLVAGSVIYLNPIHVWSQFATHALLDDDVEIPATVLFFPVEDRVRTIVVEPDAEELLRELETSGPLTLSDLLRRTPRSQREICLNVVHKLAAVGVIALGVG